MDDRQTSIRIDRIHTENKTSLLLCFGWMAGGEYMIILDPLQAQKLVSDLQEAMGTLDRSEVEEGLEGGEGVEAVALLSPYSDEDIAEWDATRGHGLWTEDTP
jgi:hypothetical protein